MKALLTNLLEVAGLAAVSVGVGFQFGLWIGVIAGGVLAVVFGEFV